MKNSHHMVKEIITITFIGVIMHLFILSNPLFNYDNIEVINGYGAGVSSGRWMLTYFGDFWRNLWGSWNLTYFNNLIFLFLMSIAAILILEIFEIKKYFLKILWGGVFLSSPALGSTLLFSYTTIYYGIAVLLSVVGVFLLVKNKWPVMAPLCFAVSLGIYQVYLSVSITLLLIYVIFDILNNDFKSCFLKAIKYLFAIVCGLMLYFVLLKIFLVYYNTSLDSYRGIDSMGQYTFASLIDLLVIAYKSFFSLPIKDYHCINASEIIHCCILLLGIFSLFYLLYKGLKKKKIIDLCFLLFCISIFPFAVNSIIIMSKNSVNNMMLFTTILIYLVPIVILDKLDVQSRLTKYIKPIILGVLTVVIVRYTYIDNLNYNNLYFINTQIENYSADLISRIKSSDGYKEGMKLAFIGDKFIDSTFVNKWADIPYKFDEYNYGLINAYSRDNFIKRYTGFSWEEIDDETQKVLLEDTTVREMTCYPDDGSIKVIDDIVVIKLEED